MKIPMIMVRWHDTSVNNIITIIIINIKSISYGYNNNKKKLREIADSVTPLATNMKAGVRYSTYAESFFFFWSTCKPNFGTETYRNTRRGCISVLVRPESEGCHSFSVRFQVSDHQVTEIYSECRYDLTKRES
jgi:hypothetical protein